MASTVLNLQTFCTGSSFPQVRQQQVSARQQITMWKKIKSGLSPNSTKPQDSSLSRSASTSKSNSYSHRQTSSTPATRRPNSAMSSNNPFADMVDSPPPYSAASNAIGSQVHSYQSPASSQSHYSAPSPSVARAQNVVDDDEFAFLREFDTIFLIDDSSSMSGPRWRETKSAIEAIVQTCVKYDEDGIDICFINKDNVYENVTSASAVREIFQTTEPRGTTMLAKRMTKILSPYIKRCERREDPKPINLIIITDGKADDDVQTVIENAAKKLDKIEAVPWQVGIQFFQVGNDAKATAFLNELDDELPEHNPGMRDIVDTQPYRTMTGSIINADGILKTVLGAVNKRQDRKKGDKLHH